MKPYYLPLAAAAVAVVALTGPVKAIDLDLTPDEIESALKVSRADEKTRAAFHGPYLIRVDDATVTRLEVITELRRLVLLAEDHVAGGDLLFTRGTREATDALRPWKGKISIATGVTFDPRNAYVLAPPIDVSLVSKSGPVPRLDQRGKSVFGTGTLGTRLPVLGAEAEADFAASSIAQSSAMLVIRADGKEIYRTAIDFRVLP